MKGTTGTLRVAVAVIGALLVTRGAATAVVIGPNKASQVIHLTGNNSGPACNPTPGPIDLSCNEFNERFTGDPSAPPPSPWSPPSGQVFIVQSVHATCNGLPGAQVTMEVSVVNPTTGDGQGLGWNVGMADSNGSFDTSVQYPAGLPVKAGKILVVKCLQAGGPGGATVGGEPTANGFLTPDR